MWDFWFLGVKRIVFYLKPSAWHLRGRHPGHTVEYDICAVEIFSPNDHYVWVTYPYIVVVGEEYMYLNFLVAMWQVFKYNCSITWLFSIFINSQTNSGMRQGRNFSDNWGGVFIHIFALCPAVFFWNQLKFKGNLSAEHQHVNIHTPS